MGSEWAEATIGSLLDAGVITLHKDGNHGSAYPRVAEFSAVGIPFLTAKLLDRGRIRVSDAPRLADEKADTLRFGFLKPNDVLLSHNATIGRVAVVPKFSGRMVIGTSLTCFRLDNDHVDPRFFAASLQGRHFQNQLRAVMSHTTRDQIPITAQRRLTVRIPPLDEQRRIANVLGALDDKIELNRKMNQTLEAMAQALFKSWFIDFDGIPDSDLVDSDLGLIPRGWKVVPLATIAQLSTASVKPLLDPLASWEHYSIPSFDKSASPSWEMGATIKSTKYRVLRQSVLVSKLNPRFPRIWLPCITSADRAICSTEFMVFEPSTENRRYFFHDLVRSTPFHDRLLGMVTGTTGSRQRVIPSQVANLMVACPTNQTITNYHDCIAPMHERRAGLTTQSRTLASLRDALLPKLISGEIRVPEAEAQVEAAL